MTPEALEEAVAEAIMGEFRNDEDSWSMMERMARAALAVVREKMPVVAWVSQEDMRVVGTGVTYGTYLSHKKVGDAIVPLIAASPLGGDKP